MFRSTSFPTDL